VAGNAMNAQVYRHLADVHRGAVAT
jgi:hypothetical protein